MQRSVLDVKQHDWYEALEALYSGFGPSLATFSPLFEDSKLKPTDLGQA